MIGSRFRFTQWLPSTLSGRFPGHTLSALFEGWPQSMQTFLIPVIRAKAALLIQTCFRSFTQRLPSKRASENQERAARRHCP